MSKPDYNDLVAECRSIGARLRYQASKGWYTGDMVSLQKSSGRLDAQSKLDPQLAIRLLFSRDKMHHSVGWWRNAEYEYCWHLSISAFPWEQRHLIAEKGKELMVQVPRAEVDFWGKVIFGEHTNKLWVEPGGTDPRLTAEEKRLHATMWHLRLFMHPEILDAKGEPFHPFVPRGEVYDLTRWIEGLTPEKVDR